MLPIHANPADSVGVPDPFRGPWFSAKVAALYVCCKNVRAFYQWRKRHGIIARSNGSVHKADLDRALKFKSRRGHHVNSLANLQRQRASTGTIHRD